ncbi:hypothetical protein FISHEDRAFT_41606 [Fistulina hepatica ATCC 64428]|nr:hypothetical protein FISHEDRAFT_41606 [Fistulina hepatica ATCC 64428]
MIVFNTVRTCIYGVIILFSVICLSMAGHFASVLSMTDLTRFVPFAIFVCAISILLFAMLILVSLILRERSPISTKIELGVLGFLGLLWLTLGLFLTCSDAQSADVECFSSESDTTALDDSEASFHTDVYRAMYRVLMVFSFANACLVLSFFAFLLILAVRRHRNGDDHMWHGPVTSCAWFKDYRDPPSKAAVVLPVTQVLPIAGVHQRHHSRSKSTNTPGKSYPTADPPRSRVREAYTSNRHAHDVYTQRPQRSRSHRHDVSRSSSGQSTLIDKEVADYYNGAIRPPNRR